MSFTFSTAQLAEIGNLYEIAKQRNANGNISNYSDVYAYIRDQLHFETDLSVDKVARWFTAATDANAGIGAVSALIRSYTQYQGELRGVPISDQMIQLASNEVAVKAIKAIIDSSGVLPTIEQIAGYDAKGVADTLFKSTIPTDSAFLNNSAWAGSVVFPGLGSDQTGNLLGGDGALNTVGDLKDILFAYDATIKGLDTANANFGRSGLMMLESYLNFGPVNSLTSMVYSGIAVFGNTLALPYMEMAFFLTPEKLLDALRKIADPNAVQDTGSGDFVQRANELFYGSAGLASNLQVQLLDQFSPSGLAALAQTDLAYRYALLKLNPFAVLGVDYTAQNANGELDLYDPATGQGSLTEQWLTDRSRFAVLNAQAAQTLEPNLFQSLDYFEDVATQTTIGIPVFTSKYIFGGSDSDSIDGGLNSDHLYGGADNDTLTGKGGNDYLEGGQGNDTYRINTGDGTDTILDTDGLGSIVYNGITLSGGQNTAPNQWQDSKGRTYILSDMGSGKQDLLINAGTEHLTIKDYTNGELGIRLTGQVAPTSFTQFGSGITVTGDRMPYQMPWNYYLWLSNPAWPYLFDSNGNMVRTSVPQPFYADKIFDSTGDDNIYAGDGLNVIYAYNGGNNHIETGANDDYIMGGNGRDRVYAGGMTDTIDTGAGDDIVYGEDGGDVINGGIGNDFLSGGAGADAINGGEGNDQIYGGDSLTWQQATTDSGIAVARQGDLLAGGSGDDVVIGDTADDALLGGDGSDTIAGREGNDILLGDSGLVFVAPPLSEFDAIIGATRWPMGPYLNFHSPYHTAPMLNIQFEKIDHGLGSVDRYQVKLSSLANPEASMDNWMTQVTTGGNDQLYGGTGDDWLFGEFGDDLLNGGADNDVLIGGVGDDILIGGKGDDVMLGGAGNDTYIINADDGVDYIYDDAFSGTNSLVFGAGVDPANIKLFQGSLGLDLGNGTVVHINGVDYNDVANTSSIQRFEFADGTLLTAQQLVARGFDLNGTEGSDTVSGTNATDRIVAGTGDDILSGGAGNDILDGGAGNDTYLFNIGDGADEIIDNVNVVAGGVEINTLVLGTGITAAMIIPIIDADGMVTLDFGNGDSIRINQMGNLSIQNIQFADGSVIATESLLNASPVANPDAVTVFEDGGVVSVPTAALLANDTDPNANDVISVVAVGASAIGASVLLTNGQVQYDIGNRFQELGAGQTITDSFGYTISDSKGATASSVVNVTLTGVNDAAVTITDTAAVQEDLNITVTGNVLSNDTDVDQGTVLSVANVGVFSGSYGNLTLAADGSYSYALDNASLAVQSLAAGQIVTETFGYQATDGLIATPSTLTVTITGTDDAPVVAIPLADLTATETGTFDYQIPVNTFTDIDTGDTLSYSATLSNSKPLPDWLVFDANSRTFHSAMPDGAAGLWDISVTATDTSGASAASAFRLDVANFIKGTGEEDKLNGTGLRDVMYGLAGDDWLRGGSAADVLVGGSGNDVLEGGSGNDILIGGIPGGSTLAGAPIPVEQSDDEHNCGKNKSGNNLLNGGSGNDTLIGGSRNDLLIGGTGNDIIDTGAGADIIAFNRGDAQDTVLVSPSTDSGQAPSKGGADNTLSLGGGIKISDLHLRHLGNDLVLETGPTSTSSGQALTNLEQTQDQITFRDWYASPNNHSINILQMIGNTEIKASKALIDQYDFHKLVESFDKAVAANATTDHWALTNAKLDSHLEQSKGEALGGDLTYQYGKNGSLAMVSLGAAQDVLDSSSFGVNPQDLHNLSGLKDGLAKLG